MSSKHLLFLAMTVFCNEKAASQVSPGFNAAIGSRISANVTCGSPAEEYFNTRQGYVHPRDRVLSICNATDPANAHPPSNMIDGVSSTFWQSSSSINDAYITIDLSEPVFCKSIKFAFGDYRRPGQMAIYKSADHGQTYTPWHYQVTSLSQCTSVFNIPSNLIRQIPDRINRTVCVEYQTYPLEYDEVVTINLNGDQRGDGSVNFDSPQLREWLNITNVHIRFTGLFRKFDFIDTRWHHYVVREINVISTCDCNGHGDGKTCPINASTGKRECQCADNTCGARCDRCCPGFNQYLWKASTGPAWLPDPTTACEKCNCFEHSDVCTHNSTVELLRMSLDIHGNYAGGGVCTNCQHDTEGINCQNCKTFFYRPEGRARNLTNSCTACKCFANGTTNQLGFDFLECIRDETSAKAFSGKASGDCFCKSNVMGRTCNECKNGFYRLEGRNSQGCLPCDCHLPGTKKRNSTCNKDFAGQCNCKENVDLRNCSQCKDRFYGLSDSDAAGCKACSCDVGASSSSVCNKNSGQCRCRNFLSGRTCLSVLDGYYFPTLHFISGSRNMFQSASYSLQTTIYVPMTTTYKIYVAYSMKSSVTLSLTLRLQKGAFVLSNGSFPVATAATCNQECSAAFHVSGTSAFNLDIGTWTVVISSSSADLNLKIEKLILVPQLFYMGSILSAANQNWFLTNCNVSTNDMRIGTGSEQRCLSYVYSLTTYFNNGALPCICNSTGSLNSSCIKYGGQCHCKQGVGARDCSTCLPGYYGFSETGCKPCGCKGPNKTCDVITGTCECPNNTVGRVCDACACNNNSNECLPNGNCINCSNNSTSIRCEVCKTGYFGSAINQTCTPCNCHAHGSRNQSCNQATGQCFCKPGVIGLRCDRCLPNYFGLISTGCFPCNCNVIGSTTKQCSSAGQCNCTKDARGLKCDTCKPGYFGLPTQPCQLCNCNSVGTVTGTFCKSDTTGQCLCKPGVTGRVCNRCMKQFVGFSSSGCQKCSLCTRQMQTLVDQQKIQLADLQLRVNETKAMSLLQAEVVRMQTTAASLQVSGMLYNQRMTKGQSDYLDLTKNYMTPLSLRHSNLISNNLMLSQKASSLVSVADANVAKMKSLETSANNAAFLTTNTSQIATSVFLSLASVTSSSDTLVSKAFKEIQGISLTSHQSMLSKITADLALSNSIRQNVSITGQSVSAQQLTSSSLSSTIQSSSSTFVQWNTTWKEQLPQFLASIRTVYQRGTDLMAILNSTKILIQQQEQYMKDTQATHASVRSILQQGTSAYQQSQAVVEESKIHMTKISGTLGVMIFQFIASTLTVKVSDAKGLVARDFPSQLSNPYFTISIRPDWNSVGLKQSPTINGTLNPVWPISDSYMFTLSSDQLQQTSVVINIYDKDPVDSDDFMGEVVIHLASIPGISSGTITRTYSIRPKGYDMIWSGNFTAGPNSIQDVQQILESQISTVQTLMTQAEATATQAQTAANALQAQAASLTSSFATAKSYATVAVNAVRTYREIYRLINSSLEAVNTANKTATDILNTMQNLSLVNMQAKVDLAKTEVQSLLATTKARNVTFPSLQFYLRSETLGSADTSTPPQSFIEIDGIDYCKHLDGVNIALIDIYTGVVESSVNFRVDSDASTVRPFLDYLEKIPGKKIVAFVKQGQAQIPSMYQALLIGTLISLGAIPPIIGFPKSSYALLGYKRAAGEEIRWIQQVGKNEGQGVSEIRQKVPLKSSLADLITLANATFQSAWPTWQEVSRRFALLQTINEKFALTESTATIVQSSLQVASIILRQATESASRVLIETAQLSRTIYDITLKYNQIVYNVGNASLLVANASASVSQAESRLPFQMNSLNSAKILSSQINATQKSVDTKISSMEAKLQKLKGFAQQVPFGIGFSLADSVVYQLRGYSQSVTKVYYNSVGFDLKPNASNGILFYMFSKPGKMSYSLGLYLQDGYLYLLYHLGYGQTLIRNNMKIAKGQWYYAYVARQGKRAILTVRNSAGLIVSAQGGSVYTQDSTTMEFTSASRVYLGGFAQGFMTSLVALYGQYSGDIDNLVVNNLNYNLWGYVSFSGSPRYAMTRYGFRPTISGTWVSLFGNGYVRHGVGSFKIDAAYSEIRLEFRTLTTNAVILGVTNFAGSFVYALYIVGGKILFQFSSGVGQNAALMTKRASYADGRWYKVTMIRTTINATLSVSMVGSTNPVHSETINVFAQTSLPKGSQIIFGAPPTSSASGLPTTGKFAGDLRYLFLSAFGTKQMLSRSFNSVDKLAELGLSYYGMVNAQVVAGVRFYGFMWWKNYGSYSSLLPVDTGLVTSISIVFKTNQMTGLIMYSTANNHYLRSQGIVVYFYMALFGGNLVITLHDSNFATLAPYMSQNLALSDGNWHTVTLLYLTSSFNYQLTVDGAVIFTGWFGNFKREIALSNPYYFGGLPTSLKISFANPTTVSLKMDVKSFLINKKVQNFYESTSFGVSYAGVAPSAFAPQPPGPPPSCGAGFPAFQLSSGASQAQFGQLPWASKESFVGYNLSEEQKTLLKSSFVITLEFKATSKDGILFYIADNATLPNRYIGLELVDGRLQFSFSVGDSSLKISTQNDYVDGKWHLLHMLRLNQFGAILLPTSKEYQKGEISSPSSEIIVSTPLYVGGLPNSVNAGNFNNRRLPFNGCLRQFEVASSFQYFSLNLAAPHIRGTSAGVGACYANVEPGVFFNGSAWVQYDNSFRIGANFNISMTFKTNQRSGLLFYLFSNDTQNGADNLTINARFIVVEINEGRIDVHYKPVLNQPFETFSWADPKSNSSYLVCDQQWHSLDVKLLGNLISITVDSYTTHLPVQRNDALIGNLYIGGVRDGISKPGNSMRFFDGCLKSIIINTKRSLYDARFGENVQLGCPSS